METLLDKHWHKMSAEKVVELLDSDITQGLDQLEGARRLKHFGPNTIAGKKPRGVLERFLLQLHQPLVYILLIACGVTAVLGEWVDSGVILAVVLVNALVGFFQESKAEKALSSLASSMRISAVVIRAGESSSIDAGELVPGDLVVLNSGDKVPADVRIINGKELRVDESALTGESVPVDKNPTSVPGDAVLADRACMVYAGTLVSSGQGRGVVVATGNKTEIGRISSLIESAKSLDTPLTRKITRFSHVLLAAILVLAVASFAFGVLRGESASEMFIAAVALSVGAIPEGLPAAVTIILALGVSRMAGRRAIIRKLPAVETLGGTTVICSDKTGTLTKNQMTVRDIYSGGAYFSVTGSGYSEKGRIQANSQGDAAADNSALLECLRAGVLCNDARLTSKEEQHTVEGDPTEAALLVSAAKQGFDRKKENENLPRKDVLPFDSAMQYMATFHETPDGTVAYMKGSVEKILACCDSALRADGRMAPLDAGKIVDVQNGLASKGLRVLAFAMKSLPKAVEYGRSDVADQMVFLGLQGMIDPPREEAKNAVAACLQMDFTVQRERPSG